MALQSTVNEFQGFGVVGSFYDSSPRRTQPMLVNSVGDYAATVGYGFTIDVSDVTTALVGGSGTVFAGILVNPKHYTRDSLTASVEVEDGTVGELCTMGRVIVQPTNSIVVGYSAYIDDTTGAIEGYSGVAAVTDKTLIEGSQFVFVDSTASTGLAVLSLTGA